MSRDYRIGVTLFIIGGFIGLLALLPRGELGGCISLNLIKQQVNKSTLGTYCWTDEANDYYCIIRKDK